MLQVHGFTFQLILHYVDQGQLVAQVLVTHAQEKNGQSDDSHAFEQAETRPAKRAYLRLAGMKGKSPHSPPRK